MKYSRILQAVSSRPWAILPEKLHAILELLQLNAQGGSVSPDVLARFQAQRQELAARAQANAVAGAVALLPLYGTISHRMNLFSDFSGGTSTEQFTKQFRAALADPSVNAIVIDIDSPGGTIDGVPELAAEIYKARGGKKKITAVANTQADSAAYWLGCQADEFVCTPSGEVGSIGVYIMHDEISKFLENVGEKITFIKAGTYKTEGNPYEPLGDTALAHLQADVDDCYAMFTRDVARARKVKADEVRNGFGEGRALGAQQALQLGMIDRIATLDDILAEHGVARSNGALRGQAHAQCLCTEGEEGRIVNRECPEHGSGRSAQVMKPPASEASAKNAETDHECKCACEGCKSGCSGCTNTECDDTHCKDCPQQAKSAKAENDNGCDCDCSACEANDCSSCDDPDCDDPNCIGCPEQEGSAKSKAACEHERLKSEIEIAELS